MNQPELKIPVVYFHSVGQKNPLWSRNFLTLEALFFEDQLKYFKKHFSVISLSEYLKIKQGLINSYKNPLVLTFDDGYLDNWTWGFPLLKKYGLKATIFVSPEFVDPRNVVRPNLEDVWEGSCSYEEISQCGYLSWEEMRLMEKSGLVDIQSHTMSHTRYFTSDVITGFHPGSDSFYAACNLAPDRKPFSISDPDFNWSLPSGYPLFEEESAVKARKIEINSEFIDQSIGLLAGYDFDNYQFSETKKIIGPLYKHYLDREELIVKTESEKEYLDRLNYEITGSKNEIEKALQKKVDFLCWPHGDSTPKAWDIAVAAGYKGITEGNLKVKTDKAFIIPGRLGTSVFHNNRFLTLRRAKFKINRYLGKFPDYQIDRIYQKIRNQ